MDRICPLLALSIDHRTAVDGFDPDHFCHAVDPAEVVDRHRQAEFCLVEGHRQCERYVAFLGTRAATAGAFPAPAPDAHLARTRQILEPEPRRASGAMAPFGASPRRWAVAGGVAVVGVAAAATAVAGGFNGFGGGTATASASPNITLSPSPTAEATAEPTAVPTAEPTEQPSPSPTQRPRNSAAATPEVQTYVVRAGDTLSLIATRFGTSVEAIQQANGLGSDVINIGQVLVIP